MVKVVGLDCASSMGLCFMVTGSPPPTWRCLAIQSEGKHGLERVADGVPVIRAVFLKEQPDIAVIEAPIEVIPKGMANANTITKLWGLAGGVVAVCEMLDIPWVAISINSWRSRYFGSGVRPQGKWKRVNGPRPENWFDDWKAMAVHRALADGIILPKNLMQARDCAEAVGIACTWRSATVIPSFHRQAYQDLQVKALAHE